MLYKATLSLICLLIVSSVSANNPTQQTKPLPLQLMLSSYTLQLPNGLSNMGIADLKVLTHTSPHTYVGIGLQNAVSGESGGYFGFHLIGGYQHAIYRQLWWQADASIGAGGGDSLPVGGGLFWQAHTGLSWQNETFSLGAGYNHSQFSQGGINSNSWQVDLSLPTELNTLPFDHWQSAEAANKQKNTQVSLVFNNYFVKKGTRDTSGQINDSNIQLLGVRLSRDLTPWLYGEFLAEGAFHGHTPNGYMDTFLGLGVQSTEPQQAGWQALAGLRVGAGGGGAINTGGGFLISPGAELRYQFNQSLALALTGGYLSAPGGDFNLYRAGINLDYQLTAQAPTIKRRPHHWRLRFGNQSYLKPKNSRGGSNPNMQLLQFGIDYYLNPDIYVSGQSAFAYHGENSGGYFSGMLGMGAQWHISPHWQLFTEGLLGAGGGGGLDIHAGLLVEPSAGIRYLPSRHWDIGIGAGQLIATQGGFNSTILNITCGWRFATT
jgi:hypothetical protein